MLPGEEGADRGKTLRAMQKPPPDSGAGSTGGLVPDFYDYKTNEIFFNFQGAYAGKSEKRGIFGHGDGCFIENLTLILLDKFRKS